MQTHSQLSVEPAPVIASGRGTSNLSGSWQEWATSAGTCLRDAADAVRNGGLGNAVTGYAALWGPTLHGLAYEVETLGGNIAVSAAVVTEGDLAAATLVTDQHRLAADQGSLLSRPVNV